MRRLRQTFCAPRGIALGLVVLSLCIRLLAPPGYMPSSHAASLTVCSAANTLGIADSQGRSTPAGRLSDKGCAFAAAGAAVTFDPPATISPPAQFVSRAGDPVCLGHQVIGLRTCALPPPSQGPPSRA